MSEEKLDEVCCPVFNPEPWDKQMASWTNQRFLKTSVHTVWYMPITYGASITRLLGTAKRAGVQTPDFMALSEHVSPWRMDLYLAVEGEVPGHETVTLSGRFLSKVYDGPFKDQGKWEKDFAEYAEKRGTKLGRRFAWYTTCPKCAKKHGHNYVVLFGEVVK